jgi:serine/threonine protein kinase
MGDSNSGQHEGAAPFLGDLNKRFRVRRLLGSGGMSIVLEAHDEKLSRDVAIKLVRCGVGADARARRLLREAKAVSKLRSKHIASVLDWGWLDEEAPFIVMELLNGHDLGTILRSEGPLSLRRALGCAIAACEALTEAHAAGIVHRDVKPSNLFLVEPDPQELLKVLDFGLAKEFRSDAGSISVTLGAHRLGTPRYMAPEQLTGSAELDQRVDVWAMAVTLYELLTGRVPFEGKGKNDFWHSILYESPRRLRDDREHAPADLEALILAALEKDPRARLPDLARFREALERVCANASETSMTGTQTPCAAVPSDSSTTLPPSSLALEPRKPPLESAPVGASRRRRRTRVALAGIALAVVAASTRGLVHENAAPVAAAPSRPASAPPSDPPPPELAPRVMVAVTSMHAQAAVPSAAPEARPIPARKRSSGHPAPNLAFPSDTPAVALEAKPLPDTSLERALRTRK